MPAFKLVREPKGGVPPLVSSLSDFERALSVLRSAPGPVAVDAERAAMYRYSHGNYLVQMKKKGTPTFLFDAPALSSSLSLWVSGPLPSYTQALLGFISPSPALLPCAFLFSAGSQGSWEMLLGVGADRPGLPLERGDGQAL